MAAGGTIGERVTDLIGDYVPLATNEEDLMNAAFNEVADMLPDELLIKYSRTPGVLTSASEWLVEDRKVLKVTRIDADTNGVERECKFLPRAEFASAKDSNSMHYATALSPVYEFDTLNAGAASLNIFPAPTTPQKGYIWYFSYATNSTNLTDIDSAELNTVYYMPPGIIHAIVLKSCINLLQTYISNFVQDDEDLEMQQMVVAQLGGLTKDFQTEMQRFTGKQAE